MNNSYKHFYELSSSKRKRSKFLKIESKNEKLVICLKKKKKKRSRLDSQKRANGIVQNNEFCGFYVGYYEKRTSRSATKTKYIEIKKNNSIETFLINFQTTGLNHLIQDQEICLSYYHNLFSEKSTIHIKTKP